MLSLANSAGRILWSSTSDFLGRKNMYRIYLGVGALLYLGLTLLTNTNKALFLLIAILILSFYGAGFATVPGLPARPVRHLPGRRHPRAAAHRVVDRRRARPGDRQRDRRRQDRGRGGGTGPVHAAFTIMVGLLVVGFVCNELIRPVSERYHEPAQEQPGTQDGGAA